MAIASIWREFSFFSCFPLLFYSFVCTDIHVFLALHLLLFSQGKYGFLFCVYLLVMEKKTPKKKSKHLRRPHLSKGRKFAYVVMPSLLVLVMEKNGILQFAMGVGAKTEKQATKLKEIHRKKKHTKWLNIISFVYASGTYTVIALN